MTTFTGLQNPTGTFLIKWTTCYKCGCVVAMESRQYDRFVETHEWFWCPNGHQQHFTGKSEAQQLRDELARQKHRTEQAEAEARQQREYRVSAERREAARKGQVTKIKNRVGNGVCPCCNRYFANLHRHMTTQHPDWSPDAEPVVALVEAMPDGNGWWRGAKQTWTKLAQRRRIAGVSVADAAKGIGLKASSLRNYEATSGPRSTAVRYAAFLDGRRLVSVQRNGDSK